MNEKRANAGIRVTAPARLHLGFLDLNGNTGRRYGSAGLAVDVPSTVVSVSKSCATEVRGDEQERVLSVIARTTAALGLSGHYRVAVERAIPAHAGLGSGTQLAIAIGAALMKLEALSLSPQQLGDLAGRGARSAIGMAAFEGGGFIVDGGRGAIDQPPPVLVQTAFPDDWRVLLVLDRTAQGAHGDREAKAFAALPHFPEELSGALCRLVLMQLLPGLKEADIETFGAALTKIQEIVGGHFASAQGGSPWTSPAVGRLVKSLEAAGATGIGQTSWGPTGFAFVSSEAAAARLYHSFVGDATAMGLEIMIARGRNAGARIETF
ncbi:MAG: beta-ribofuranosylaminobenzene 5'-phosphate synthase family protein [Hyphomicrobium sp.]|jgi:beta-RFAP synthase